MDHRKQACAASVGTIDFGLCFTVVQLIIYKDAHFVWNLDFFQSPSRLMDKYDFI